MGKRMRRKPAENLIKPGARPRPSRLGLYSAAAMVVAALALLALYMSKPPAQKQVVQREATQADKLRAIRPAGWPGVIDPGQFTGRTAKAYLAAKQIPEVLNKLFCYCGCDRIAGHLSVLDCFRDMHAAS